MSFTNPTLPELVSRIGNDLFARLQNADQLRRNDAVAQAAVMAACAHSLYDAIAYLSRQIIVDTAEGEWLDRWASIWLQEPRKAASAATGTVTLTTQDGAFVPAGTLVKALDDAQYATVADATADDVTLDVEVEAVVPGAAGNRLSGQSVNLVSPVAGVQTSALAGELSGGADVESDDALRERVLDRIRNPPHGGTVADYVRWALEVSGVTRAWGYENWNGVGTMKLLFVRDDDVSPIPDAGELATVDAYLRDDRKPAGCVLTTGAPVADPLAYTLEVFPDTPEVRAAVRAELADLHRREAVPGGTLLISHIRAAISAAAGEENYALSAPTADVTVAAGHISTVGAFTWL